MKNFMKELSINIVTEQDQNDHNMLSILSKHEGEATMQLVETMSFTDSVSADRNDDDHRLHNSSNQSTAFKKELTLTLFNSKRT